MEIEEREKRDFGLQRSEEKAARSYSTDKEYKQFEVPDMTEAYMESL